MKNSDPVPLREQSETNEQEQNIAVSQSAQTDKKKEKNEKKKKKHNLWPLKAFVITLFLSAGVNAASELVLSDAQIWLSCLLTLLILALGVAFDMVGTAATSCDVEPFLAMASRKVKGAKTAVKLSKKSHIVSSVCCDIVGDICGIVSGVCAASIVLSVTRDFTENLSDIANFFIKVAIYAIISTMTITFKAIGKNYAVNRANNIIFGVAKFLSVFRKEG